MKKNEVRTISRAHWKYKTTLGFALALSVAVSLIGGWFWLHSRPEDWGTPGPLRAMLRWNERVTRPLYSTAKTDIPARTPRPGTPPKVNGRLGLMEDLELREWRLHVETPKGSKPLVFSVEDLAKWPVTSTHTEFRCIEGWSELMSYTGIRFSDFMAMTGVGTKSGKPYTKDTPRSDLYNYVALETPDGEYYVSVDIESMLHPQTFLATGMNGMPLNEIHGAPLRLMIPVKYGIKSLKRIGRIYFSDELPPDYWAERGYDWFAGL